MSNGGETPGAAVNRHSLCRLNTINDSLKKRKRLLNIKQTPHEILSYLKQIYHVIRQMHALSNLSQTHNMALISDNQRQYEKALELYEWALAGREKALRVEHPDTLGTVHNMVTKDSMRKRWSCMSEHWLEGGEGIGDRPPRYSPYSLSYGISIP